MIVSDATAEDNPVARAWWPRLSTTAWTPLILVAVILTFLFARLTIDDAFITWRYGRMFAEHGIWGFNPFPPPVEAYTNPLYAAASVIPAITGIPAELFFKLVSAGLLATLVATVLRTQVPAHQRLVLLVITVANPTFHIHLWAGLETALFVLLLMLTYGRVYRTGGLGGTGYALVLALALTRPEGIGYAFAIVAWTAVLQPTMRRWLAFLAFVVALTGYWVARAAYFNLAWPNTFYVKTSNTGIDLAGRVHVIIEGLLVMGLAMAAVLAVGAFHRRRAGRVGPLRSRPVGREAWVALTPVLLAGASVAVLLVVYDSGNLLMDYANRFEWQVIFPVLLVCLLRPIDELTRRPVATAVTLVAAVILVPDVIDRPWRLAIALAVIGCAGWLWVRTSAASAMAAVVAVTVAISWLPVSGFLQLVVYRPRLVYAHEALGTSLSRHGDADSVLSVGDAGLIPFDSGWTTIDVHGLADHEIAMGDFTAADLQSDPPEVIVVLAQDGRVSSERHRVPAMAVTAAFARDPANDYVFSPGVFLRPGYRLHVWMRADVAPKLQPDLDAAVRESLRVNDMSDGAFLQEHLFDFPFLESDRAPADGARGQ